MVRFHMHENPKNNMSLFYYLKMSIVWTNNFAGLNLSLWRKSHKTVNFKRTGKIFSLEHYQVFHKIAISKLFTCCEILWFLCQSIKHKFTQDHLDVLRNMVALAMTVFCCPYGRKNDIFLVFKGILNVVYASHIICKIGISYLVHS